MRIWIDLANSPHVPFFSALVPEFKRQGIEVAITARDFAETVALAAKAHLSFTVIGSHGGKRLTSKGGNLVSRARALRAWARQQTFELAVSHNSYSQIVAARLMGIRTVTLMDYEHQPANHLAFRLAHRVVVPDSFPEAALRRLGAGPRKVCRYKGTKEDVYLSDFQRDYHFADELAAIGIGPQDVVIVVRPPAAEALYHRFENELFDSLLEWLATRPVKVLLLPRNVTQRTYYSHRGTNIFIPDHPLDGSNLIAFSDLLISAGGTMNREAAALGVPAASIYVGRWAAVDEGLCRAGRLLRITSANDFELLPITKKTQTRTSTSTNVREEVLKCILS
jgi:uncharacterized protein